MSHLWKALIGHMSSFARGSQLPRFLSLFSSVFVCTCLHGGTWIWKPDVNMCLSQSLCTLFFFFETVLPLNLEYTDWLCCLASKPQGSWCIPPHLTFYMDMGEPNSVPLSSCLQNKHLPNAINFFSFIGLAAQILFYFFPWRKPISVALVGELCEALKESSFFPSHYAQTPT